MIVVNLSKQQAPDADPKAIQQINLTTNLDRAGNTRTFFHKELQKYCKRVIEYTFIE